MGISPLTDNKKASPSPKRILFHQHPFPPQYETGHPISFSDFKILSLSPSTSEMLLNSLPATRVKYDPTFVLRNFMHDKSSNQAKEYNFKLFVAKLAKRAPISACPPISLKRTASSRELCLCMIPPTPVHLHGDGCVLRFAICMQNGSVPLHVGPLSPSSIRILRKIAC